MTTRITLLAVTIMLAAAASSFAGAGAFLTYQDTGDAGSGYGIGLKLERDLTPQVSIDGRLSVITGTSISDRWWSEDITIIPIEGNLNWNVPMMGYTPYFGAGIGYYYFDPDWIDADIGFNIHGGVKLDTGRGMQAFAELRYLNLEPDGGDFGGIGLVAGISWGVW